MVPQENKQMDNTQLVKQRDQEETINISLLWRTISRARWGIVGVTLCALIIGSLIANSAVPIYQASTKILANPQPPNAARDEQYIASALVFLFFETQYEIIQSRNLAETVVDKLDLVEKYKQAQQEKDKKPKSGISSMLSEIKTELSALFANSEQKDKPIPMSDDKLRIMLASGIQANLKVSGGLQSQIINISYQSSDPQQATDIVNALSAAYIQFGLNSRLGEVKKTESWLTDQFVLLKDKLQESELILSNFRSQQGLVDTEQQQRIANTQLQSLNNELIRAQTVLSSAEEQHLTVMNVPKGSKALYSLGPVLQNATASDMVKTEAVLSLRVNEFVERYGEKHPEMIAARSELKSAQANLQREISKVIDNIETNYRLAQSQVVNIEKLISKIRNDIQSVQSENFSLVSLEREVENNRSIYENFQSSLMEASGRSEFNASNVEIIDTATVPESPIKPNVKFIIILSAFAGVFFGIVLAFLKEALHNTFRTPSALEEELHIPALGITMALSEKGRHGIPEMEYLNDTRSLFAESINTIRTGLQFSNIDNPPKTILVSSATGSEGKSTLSMNLALAYSQIGKTLLLEVDLRKPSLAKNLKIESKQGLTDSLTGAVNLGECIVNPTDDKQFNVLPCGTIPPNPIELLSSDKFTAVLQSLAEQFDHIILDGPPTLPVSDACVLANKVDGVILAVKSESTKIKVSKQAVTRLKKLNANVIGAVLTVAETQKISYYGDNYYSAEYYGVEKSNE
jgi:succinoglycan biosynthesis transport protein ExoP